MMGRWDVVGVVMGGRSSLDVDRSWSCEMWNAWVLFAERFPSDGKFRVARVVSCKPSSSVVDGWEEVLEVQVRLSVGGVELAAAG